MDRKNFLKASTLGAASLFSAPILANSMKNSKDNEHINSNKKDLKKEIISHKFNLEKDGMLAVDNSGGKIKLVNKNMFPILEGLTFYLVELAKGGLREPHWHPNAHELNFVVNGKVKIGVLSANNSREEEICEPGDIFFIPQGYFHYITNENDGPSKILVGFSNPNPEDIGLTGAYGFLSNDMLAQTLGTTSTNFTNIPKPDNSLLMMGKLK